MARALDLHSRGQGFDSLILHQKKPGEVSKEEGKTATVHTNSEENRRDSEKLSGVKITYEGRLLIGSRPILSTTKEGKRSAQNRINLKKNYFINRGFEQGSGSGRVH